MRRPPVLVGVAFLALATFAMGLGWLVFQASTLNGGSRSLGPAWPYALSVVLVPIAIGLFLIVVGLYARRHDADEGF
jgi:hypothetical protein